MENKTASKAESILRLSATVLSALSSALVWSDTETETVLFIHKKASSRDLLILWVFTITATVAAGYHLLQICRRFLSEFLHKDRIRGSSKFWAWFWLLLDQYQVARGLLFRQLLNDRSFMDMVKDTDELMLSFNTGENLSGRYHGSSRAHHDNQPPLPREHGRQANLLLTEGKIFLGVGVAYAMFAITVAATQGSMVAVTGVRQLQWSKICNIYTKFCHQIAGGLLCGIAASVAMAMVAAISARGVFRLYPAYPKSKPRWNMFYSNLS